MASTDKNLSEVGTPLPDDNADLSIGIVVSEWNREITEAMYRGCYDFLLEKGVSEENITKVDVPGSFELPIGAKLLMSNQKLDAVICIGCIVKGETRHDEYIAKAVAQSLVNLSIMSNIPCIFGVLTTDNIDQARDRAGQKHGNKGVEAAATAIRMAHLKKNFVNTSKKIGY